MGSIQGVLHVYGQRENRGFYFWKLSFDLSLMRFQNNTKSNVDGNERKRNQTKRRPVFVNKVYMYYGQCERKSQKERKLIKASFHKLVFHTAVVQ